MLVIVPTRGRPQAVGELATTFYDTVSYRGAHLVFGVDSDDPELAAYEDAMYEHLELADWVEVNPRMGMVGTLNHLAMQQAPQHDVIGFLGDDHRFRTMDWDLRVKEALANQPGVVYGNDLLQGLNLPTAVFISSDIILKLGYMAPPSLSHLYVDNAWLEIGKATNLTYLPDVVIEHMHPTAGKAEWDEGYKRVNDGGLYERDRVAFERFMADQWPTDVQRVLF